MDDEEREEVGVLTRAQVAGFAGHRHELLLDGTPRVGGGLLGGVQQVGSTEGVRWWYTFWVLNPPRVEQVDEVIGLRVHASSDVAASLATQLEDITVRLVQLDQGDDAADGLEAAQEVVPRKSVL